MPNVVLGDRYDQLVEILLRLQVYNNRSEALRAAVGALHKELPAETRMAAGVLAYGELNVTIGRAAELALCSFDEMEARLEKEGALERGTRKKLTPNERRARARGLAESMKK